MTPGRRIDLHVHSKHSPDGEAGIDRLVQRLAELRLDGLALTDHNTVSGHSRLAELARDRPELRLIPGVEVSTREGHLLGYGIHEVPPTDRPVGETIEWVNAHGGVAVLAHPFRRVHGVGGAVAQASRVPAVEVMNGHNGPTANGRARRLAEARSLGATGGSDAHATWDLLGRTWTRFPDGAESLDDLLEALRRGSTSAEGRSAGPLTRARIALRSFGLRVQRGFRPI